jgi:hypothetical protein
MNSDVGSKELENNVRACRGSFTKNFKDPVGLTVSLAPAKRQKYSWIK